ncbi:ABC transporter, periplasmic metal-binding protein, TroA_e family [Syntrophotalea carbinolica DSM 2380]|uniref:ABC transporter, periplasmic metal-binding protein, TroA_e family n=2 Tax=Syntrophotalea carbinolica TaxID=19 RepID=Q3A883_SYNC1|nr:ABC transporter, periplasmic metal-binding protein, TroA_e family [Syntrophotalea carbinolica DSM 2380]
MAVLMRKSMLRFFCLIVALLLTVSGAQGRTITDMAGRQVQVPDHIHRVLGAVSPVTWMIYALDPRLLAGINSALSHEDWDYLDPYVKALPVMGGFGGTRGVNRETLLALRPDVVIFWGWNRAAVNRRLAQQLEGWGVPVVFVDLDRFDRYGAALRFLGDLLDREERAEQLAAYGERALAAVCAATADIPDDERARVYYAEGMDGLETEPQDSFHAELIPLAGGSNVHRGTLKHYRGRDKLSLEQVLLYDPEVILVQENVFFEAVKTDARWQKVQAVRDGRVWLVPDMPANWFDRPPSFMRYLGLQWLAHQLYPKRFPLDLKTETREFYKRFLGTAPDDEQLKKILGSAG